MLHVGRRCPALDARFAQPRRYALVTACNPGGELTSESANRLAAETLDAELARTGRVVVPALNSAPDGSWPEPSRLVLDLPLPQLDALASRFGQAGVLAWERGRAVRLRLYRPAWRAAARAARVDTRFIDWVACAPP